jgi:hypothetical protein
MLSPIRRALVITNFFNMVVLPATAAQRHRTLTNRGIAGFFSAEPQRANDEIVSWERTFPGGWRSNRRQ